VLHHIFCYHRMGKVRGSRGRSTSSNSLMTTYDSGSQEKTFQGHFDIIVNPAQDSRRIGSRLCSFRLPSVGFRFCGLYLSQKTHDHVVLVHSASVERLALVVTWFNFWKPRALFWETWVDFSHERHLRCQLVTCHLPPGKLR